MSFLFKRETPPSDARPECKSSFFTVHRRAHAAIQRCISTGELCANESAKDKQPGPGKIVEPGRLVTRLHQTSLWHQNTFRCSDRLDQDIEVSRSIWLAELGDWGHFANRKGNKVSLCGGTRAENAASKTGSLPAIYRSVLQFLLGSKLCVFSLSKTSEKIQVVWLKKYIFTAEVTVKI